MTQTFNYSPKFSWSFLFLAAVGIAGIAYAFISPFSIRFKNFTLLEYPGSKYAVIAIGILFIVYTIHKWLKVKAMNSAQNLIELSANQMIFKHLEGYTLSNQQLLYFEVNELWNKSDEDDGESIILYTENSKNRYEFFAENFDSAGDFAEFKKWLETKCVNITNRE